MKITTGLDVPSRDLHGLGMTLETYWLDVQTVIVCTSNPWAIVGFLYVVTK